ncbi:hypothetical protein GRW34_22685, partial [Escherichia coli]|nr:hypothetical protein [Escherichia coli]
LTAASSAVAMIDANGGSFATAVPDLLPGDYFHRYVDLRNSSSAAAGFAGQVTATGDLAGVLSVQVDGCPQASSADHTCSGIVTPLVAKTAASSAVPVNYGTIAPGDSNAKHVRYLFTMSDTAPATMMGKSGTIAASVSSTLT